MQLEIGVLGPLEVRLDGEPVPLAGAISRRIVAALALGGPVTAARLIDVVWGDDPPASATGSLQAHVSRLRRRLGREVVASSVAGYELRGADLDARRFRLLAESADGESLHAALTLVRGEPLSDLADVGGLAGERRALIELVRQTRLRWAERSIGEGAVAEVIPELERMVAVDPLDEAAWLALARALHTAGRQADAIGAIDRYRRAVAEVGLEPSAALSSVEDVVYGVAVSPPTSPAPDDALTAARTEVRPRRTTFVGREAEASAVTDGLRRTRMVTVTGPGGMGKTRLAEEIAIRLSPSLEGGVVEVELGSVEGGGAVAPAVARAFGLRSVADPVAGVAAAVGARPTLVVLDRCEHVVDGARGVAERLLDAAPSVWMLATSRAPLEVEGEQVVPLAPLDAGAAFELFCDRARLAHPGFDATDRSTIDLLCARLDRMPLALEMAAARVRSTAPGDLLVGIRESLGSPGGGRHADLDALVGSSYDLLSPDDAFVFRRLGVFAGRFEAADAAAVVGRSVADAVAMLGRLVDRSMCQADVAGPVTEYHLLQTLREASRARLELEDEAADSDEAHSRWVVAAVEAANVGLNGPDEARWHRRLSRMVPDVIAAHRRALAAGDLDLQVRLLGPLFSFVYLSLPPGVARLALDTLDRHGDDVHPLLPRMEAIAAAAAAAHGDMSSAHRHLRRALERPGGGDDLPVWFMLTDVAVYEGDLAAAGDTNRRVIELARESPSAAHGWMDGLITEAIVASYSGRDEDAASAAHAAMAVASTMGGPSHLAMAEYATGEILQDVRPAEALVHLRRSIQHAAGVGNRFVEGVARTTVASILARTGDHGAAVGEFVGLIDLFESTGARTHSWTAIRNLIVLLGELGAWADAAVLLGATTDRVSPTFGVEAERLAGVSERLHRTLSDADRFIAEGAALAVAEVPTRAREAISRLRPPGAAP